MPRTPSSPAERLKWLQFVAGDEESHELFAPGPNWRKQDQCPALKPLDSYSRDYRKRLACELLRRMERYRRQYRNLDQFGIKLCPRRMLVSSFVPVNPGSSAYGRFACM